jgi:hypothetical protein
MRLGQASRTRRRPGVWGKFARDSPLEEAVWSELVSGKEEILGSGLISPVFGDFWIDSDW